MTGEPPIQARDFWRVFAGLLLCLGAAGAMGAAGFAVVQRAGVPFALEWQEPTMLEHALRVRAGESIYVEPSVAFAPFPYPPVYHWLGALSCWLIGPSLLALRLVSLVGLLAVLGTLMGSFRWVSGIAAAGWFAATWGWSGFWLDVARVDSLALGLGALGFAAVLAAGKRSRVALGSTSMVFAALGGVASALAILTKQTQLGLAAALLVALLLRARTRRAGAVYLVACGAVLAPMVLWLEHASSGWFLWTTVDLLRGSPFHGPAIWGFWAKVAPVLGLPALLGILAILTRGERSRAASQVSPVLRLGGAGLVLSGWAGFAHAGGFDNALLPVALASAFACGAALEVLLDGPRGRWAATLSMVGATVLMFPFPSDAIPGAGDRAAYDEAVARVAAIAGDGDVWQPVSALPSTRPGFVHKMAIVDLAKSRETEVAAWFLEELRIALSERRFTAIVLASLPREGWGDLARLIEANYELSADLTRPGDGSIGRLPLTPVTGAPVRPRYVLTPKAK